MNSKAITVLMACILAAILLVPVNAKATITTTGSASWSDGITLDGRNTDGEWDDAVSVDRIYNTSLWWGSNPFNFTLRSYFMNNETCLFVYYDIDGFNQTAYDSPATSFQCWMAFDFDGNQTFPPNSTYENGVGVEIVNDTIDGWVIYGSAWEPSAYMGYIWGDWRWIEPDNATVLDDAQWYFGPSSNNVNNHMQLELIIPFDWICNRTLYNWSAGDSIALVNDIYVNTGTGFGWDYYLADRWDETPEGTWGMLNLTLAEEPSDTAHQIESFFDDTLVPTLGFIIVISVIAAVVYTFAGFGKKGGI